jgi:phenylalanyl-tRNA synthetase beta chain
MKIAFSWLKEFLDINASATEISALLTGCGLEVEHLEKWQSLKGGLAGVVTGHVLTCERHPNADRLNLTTVDVGQGEPKHIVCGAPNIAAGQKVIVALPGAVLFPISGESFEIKKSKIRGEVSDGMICAEDEIGLGASHAGVMVLPENTPVGMPAADYFNLTEDWIFEIGLTPNRADAASHLGVARDLKALLGKDKQVDLKLPDLSKFKTQGSPNEFEVLVKDRDGCQRYSGLHIKNLKVQDSPLWLQHRLKSIGLRPINNIVDITNYVMHHLGQPLHAFDAAKITGRKVIVDTLPAGTKFKTLDDNERELTGIELMICDAEKGLCIAGVFGGIGSGVTDSTTEIFLESACFNPVRVRKAARAHGLHTDSSFRFERGTDPEMTVVALKLAALLIAESAGGEIQGDVIDIYPSPVAWKKINLSFDYVNSLSGNVLPKADVKRILSDLLIRIVDEKEDHLKLEIPPFKVEVTRQADLVEEIIRIYGYNAIVLPKKLNISVAAVPKPDPEELNYNLAEWLVANGYTEILTNSLTKLSYAELLPLPEGEQEVRVLNPLSNDLGMLRHQMMLTGLEAISYNLNRKQKGLRFFETGNTYKKVNGKYIERHHLSLWITGDRHDEHWKQKSADYDIYYLKSVVNNLLEYIGINPRLQLSLAEVAEAMINPAISYTKKSKQVAILGQVPKAILKAADISQPVYYAEFDLDEVIKLVPTKEISAPEPPKFPEVRRDLSMVLNREVKYAAIEELAYASEPKLLRNVNLFDVYEGEKIGEGKKSYALSFTLSDAEATLQDKQIDGVMNKLMKQFEEKLGALIRKQ